MRQIRSDSRDTLPYGEGECPCAGGTLPKFVHPAILIVLAEGPAHGYRLVERLASVPTLDGQRPDSTGIYRMLAVMQKQGLVQSSWDTSGPGPAVKTYCLTDQGRDCLAVWAVTLRRHATALQKLARAASAAAVKSSQRSHPRKKVPPKKGRQG
jgi:PadR family transcriptional regulator, regulatory protein PadR